MRVAECTCSAAVVCWLASAGVAGEGSAVLQRCPGRDNRCSSARMRAAALIFEACSLASALLDARADFPTKNASCDAYAAAAG